MLKKGILMLCCLLCSSWLVAQSGSAAQEFKEKLERTGSRTKTIQCDFTQEKKVKNIRQAVQGKGRFYYDNSGRMALIYQQPQGDKVLMDGTSFTLYAGGKKVVSQAEANPMLAQIAYMMQACMSGDVSKLGRGWEVEIEEEAHGYAVRLKPVEKRIQKYISGMLMRFDKTNLTLNVLRIEERSGGYTEYIFFNKQLNQKLDPQVFQAE